MRRNSAYENPVWGDDEEPGLVKAEKEPIKIAKLEAECEGVIKAKNEPIQIAKLEAECEGVIKAIKEPIKKAKTEAGHDKVIEAFKERIEKVNIEVERRRRWCTNCSKEKESTASGARTKTCQVCLATKCLGKARADEFPRRQSLIKALLESSKKRNSITLPPKSISGKNSMQPESVQDINNAIRKSPALLSDNKKGDMTALDKELKDVANKATMGALKRKLDQAEKAEKKAKSALAATQTTKRACLGRIKTLDKQEARDQTAAVEAEKLIEHLKLRIVQQEG